MRIVAMYVTKEVKVFNKLSAFAVLALFITTASADNTPGAEPAIIKTSHDGATYGYASAFDYGYEPDYIKAIATNGKEGYVKKSDLHNAEQQAGSPEEAIRLTRKHDDALLAAFTTELTDLAGGEQIDTSIASELLSAELKDPLSPSTETESASLATSENQFTNEELDQALLQAMESISTSIPVYAEDGMTVIGEFLVG